MSKLDVLAVLNNAGFSAYLKGFSAIDIWLGRDAGNYPLVLTNADTADLARLFEALRYPGVDLADAALDTEEETFYFFCTDSDSAQGKWGRRPYFNILEFYQEYKTRIFHDPAGIYPLLRQIRSGTINKAGNIRGPQGLDSGNERCRALMDGALILAKYFPLDSETGPQIPELFAALREGHELGPAPGLEEQRLLLTGLLTSPNPGLALELLKGSGFIEKFWPELAALDDVDHSKEFHPEGNVWRHTLETFRYRKPGLRGTFDLRLSLGLLLHDAGKPIAESAGSRRFDGHAELGEVQARRFLGRIGFGSPLVNDVCYLVKNHMLPAALPRLPFFRTGEIMASPLFPVLLELYRCDESSSFRGLDGYYESSAAYRAYLRNRQNPYRSADGKKINLKNSR